MNRTVKFVCLAVMLAFAFLQSGYAVPAPAGAKKLMIAVAMEPINLDVSLVGE